MNTLFIRNGIVAVELSAHECEIVTHALFQDKLEWTDSEQHSYMETFRAFFQTATRIATYQNDHLRGGDSSLDVESRLP